MCARLSTYAYMIETCHVHAPSLIHRLQQGLQYVMADDNFWHSQQYSTLGEQIHDLNSPLACSMLN